MNYKEKTKQKVSLKTIDGQKVSLIEKNISIDSFKVLDEEKGIFEAHCSVFGNVDSYGEIVDKGAFTKWLAEYFDGGKKRFPKCVWAHKWDEPIAATLECYEDEKGLYVKGQFVLEVQRAREVYALMKAGVITDFSFGFSVLDYYFDEATSLIHLKEIAIYEWSPVLVGANRDAVLESVKSDGQEADEDEDAGEEVDEEGADDGADDPAPNGDDDQKSDDVEKPDESEESEDSEADDDGEEGDADSDTETEEEKAARLEKRSEALDDALDAAKSLTSALEALKATERGEAKASPKTSKKVDERGGKGKPTPAEKSVAKVILRDARKADKVIEKMIVRAKSIIQS